MIKKLIIELTILLIGLCFLSPCEALTYALPYSKDAVVGQTHIIQSRTGDTLHKIARRYEMGIQEIARANPRINRYRKIKANTAVTIPAFFVLPNTPRRDIIVNLPEMRLYFYTLNHQEVVTEPISVGRLGWETPLMETKIVEKIKDPYWIVPNTIWDYSAQKGVLLPRVVAPGPDNPLGHYALRLGNWSILIHGTNDPVHIGQRISSGCIRMYPEDIAKLYELVDKLTPVTVIDQPYKVGWRHHKLYLEIHPALKEYSGYASEEWQKVHDLILSAAQTHGTRVNWATARKIFRQKRGIPYPIGTQEYW